jgi:hypothetical protein
VRFLVSILTLTLGFGILTAPAYAATDFTKASYWEAQISTALEGGGVSTAADLSSFLSRLGAVLVQTEGSAVQGVAVYVNDGSNNYVAGQVQTASTELAKQPYLNPDKAAGKKAPDTSLYTEVTGIDWDIYSRAKYPSIDVKADLSSIKIYVANGMIARDTSKLSRSVQSGLMDGYGIVADTGSATKVLGPFMGVLNTLLGVLVSAIGVFMLLYTASDCAYIAFPVYRGKVDSHAEKGGAGTRTNKKTGEAGVWYVSPEAIQAVKEAEEAQKQAWGGYLKKRIAAFIFLAIIMFIILTGNIFLITDKVTDLVSGILEAIGAV